MNALQGKNDELTALNLSLEQLVEKRTEELKKAYKEMKEIAIKDSLTKIYNRYFFNDALENEIHRANRYNSNFSLCMFDLDHFKRVNDSYGHDAGDKVLKDTARIIKKHLRESDIFARVGGEEFMILFPKTTLDDSSRIARRILNSIQKHQFETVGGVTLSIGLVAYRPEEGKEELLKRVDNALYEAKESGRDRVIVDM